MESSIGSIVNKIDAVLVRLETMEGSKARRRAAMNKMLNSITENDDGEWSRGPIFFVTMHLPLTQFARFLELTSFS